MEGEALFAPKMITINDLFLELSGGQLVDKIEALYILYQEYAELFKAQEEKVQNTFDEFVYWGDVFLNDFDDIDKYLVDADKLFSNIGDLRKLTADENDYLSEEQKRAIKEFYTSWTHSKKSDIASKKNEDNGDKEESIEAVSYTHLDVYKRQIQSRTPSRLGKIERSSSLSSSSGLVPTGVALTMICCLLRNCGSRSLSLIHI